MPTADSTVHVVTTAADGGVGSLRDAIQRANADGRDARVVFAVGSGPTAIRLTAPLPPVSFPGLIDGWSQPGPAGRPSVEINGADAASGSGLEIVGDGLTVRGLSITGWRDDGVHVHDCVDVGLLGLHIGVGLDGATAAGNGGSGIHVVRADRCVVGGPGAKGVVSSGNRTHGIWLEEGARQLRLAGSFIGTDRSGATALPNGQSGVKVEQAYGAVVGAVDDGALNVISGNMLYGIEIGGPLARGAVVIGNHIGTDATGLTAVPNGRSGIVVYNTPDVRIGGPSEREGNVISGSARAGVNLDGSVTTFDGYDYTGKGHARGNVVQGNLIGVDRTGERALGNRLRGVLINYAQDNTIVDNTISGNAEDGVLILGPDDDSDPNLVPSGNRLLGNRIGVTHAGASCGNGRHGVLIRHGRANEIGSGDVAEANAISGNSGRGVVFSGLGARTNVLHPSNDLAGNGLGEFHQPRD